MKKYTALILTILLTAALSAGCGSSQKEETKQEITEAASAATTKESTSVTEAVPEVKPVLNIYSIGEDFKSRVQDFYPDYEITGDNTGMIDGTEVRWHVFNDVTEYREALDSQLDKQTADSAADAQGDAEQDDKIDIFVADEAYVRDYVESGYTLDIMADIGLTEEELADQFPYTKQIATDPDGRLKAVTWQATPGVFAYRRSIAKEVLGTDEPEKVQEAVSDWDRFEETAAAAKEMGYYMLSGYGDAYDVYADNVQSAWVEDGVLNIDPHLIDWAEQTREFTEMGYTHGTDLWSDEWKADHTGDGEVLGFFYSSWGIRYTLQDKAEGNTESEEDTEEHESAAGDYAVCKGPEPVHYGGQWILAAAGGDNTDLVRYIMYSLTCDQKILKKITMDIHEFTNSVSAMTELAQSDYEVEVLGGQNPIPVYLEVAKELKQTHTTSYDDDLDLGFQISMEDYFTGAVPLEDAIETFRKVAVSRYEEISGGEEEEAEEEGDE